MRARSRARRGKRSVYRKAGRACPRCGTPIRSRGQGDDNRTPTGARAAREERSRRARRGRVGWPCAPRTSTAPCAASASRASRCSRTTWQAGTRSRSPSRSTPRAGQRRSTSTGRSCARTSRRAAERLSALADARLAIEELGREPAAADLRRRARRQGRRRRRCCGRSCCRCSPTSPRPAAGFDWSDEAFDRAYAELERSLLGERRTYAAVAPLVGLSLGTQVELADGLRIRVAAAGELAAHWPEANGLLPAGFGTRARPALRARARARAAAQRAASRPTRRASSPTRSAPCASRPRRPSPPARCCSSGSTGGRWRSARCCRSPRPSRPGEPTRLDAFRARLASDLLARLGRAEEDPELARGARPLGAVAVRGRAVSLGAAARGAVRAARRARRTVGGRRCGRRCCSARPARDRAEQLERLARARAGRDGRRGGCRCGAQGGRRDARPRRPGRARRHRSTKRSSASAPGRPATSPRWPPELRSPLARRAAGAPSSPGTVSLPRGSRPGRRSPPIS